jgi:hypothetical protein
MIGFTPVLGVVSGLSDLNAKTISRGFVAGRGGNARCADRTVMTEAGYSQRNDGQGRKDEQYQLAFGPR